METVPAEIAGIGSTQQRLRVAPGFDPLKASVGPEEYFVLSRIDGSQTLHQLLLGIGLPLDRGVAIVTRLRELGALLVANETAPPPPRVAIQPARQGTTPPPRREPTVTPGGGRARRGSMAPAAAATMTRHDRALPHPSAEEQGALSEANDLPEGPRRLILAIARLIPHGDPYALLGVDRGVDPREIKRAYFHLSKEIHPDRYYGKQLGSFSARMSTAFDAVSRAYGKLTGSERTRRPSNRGVDDNQPQSPQAYAAELFSRACDLEVSGDALGAMKLFAAAVRVDSQPRYLRRAASCALAAGQPRSALEYAKKAHALAPTDPSAARLLAAAFRATGKLSEAEEVLVMAMALKSENDTLMAELRNDLAELRQLLTP